MRKIFGAGPSIEKLRRALEQGSYAEAVHLADDLVAAGESSADLADLQAAAADGLAGLNLEEGLRSLQAGSTEAGLEHLELALTLVRAPELRARVENALTQATEAQRSIAEADDPAGQSAPSACGDGTAQREDLEDTGDLPDLHSQLELILAAYPPEVQQRYLARSEDFLRAFLHLHGEDDRQALSLWLELAEVERDGLYLFELGSLYGRLGETDKGLDTLQQALGIEPGNLLIIDALLTLLLGQSDVAAAQKVLQEQLDGGAEPGFCHARQCELQLLQQENASAFDAARKAIAAGFADPGFVVLAARLFEQAGQVEEAEKLLSSLPSGSCGGGINLHLAELWLRQRHELGRVLDAFNGACRQEPDNPRWQLRVAQTYLARNWRKQGFVLLRRVAGDPRLDEELRAEADQLLSGA